MTAKPVQRRPLWRARWAVAAVLVVGAVASIVALTNASDETFSATIDDVGHRGSTPGTDAPTSTVTTPTPTVATAAAPPDSTPPRSYCVDDRGDGFESFDLLQASILRLPDGGGYLLDANAVGPHAGSNVSLTFWLGDFSYSVNGGVRESGVADNWLLDTDGPQKEWLPNAVYSEGTFSVTVTDNQIEKIAGTVFDWHVMLTVDGFDIDDCAVEAFGVTVEGG